MKTLTRDVVRALRNWGDMNPCAGSSTVAKEIIETWKWIASSEREGSEYIKRFVDAQRLSESELIAACPNGDRVLRLAAAQS